MDASGGEGGDKGHYLVGTVILGFLSIFKKCQASALFEALNSVCVSSCKGCEAHCVDETGTYGFL